MEVVVVLFGSLTLPILIKWVVRRNLYVRPARKNRILFCAAAAEDHVLHAIHLVDLSRMHVAIKDRDVQVFRVRSNCIVRVLIIGDGAEAGAAESRIVESDEDLLRPV